MMNYTGLVDEIYSGPGFFFNGFEKLKLRKISDQISFVNYLRSAHQESNNIYEFAAIVAQEMEP